MIAIHIIRRTSLIVISKPYTATTVKYGRWINRKTAKVYLPYEDLPKTDLKKEKIIDLEEIKQIKNKAEKPSVAQSNITKDIVKEKQDSKKVSKKPEQNKQNICVKEIKVFDENNELVYEKLGDNDGRISDIIISCKSKNRRSKSERILVEGWRLIMDGLEAKSSLQYVIFSRLDDLNHIRPFLPKTGVKIYKIPYKEIKMWSNLETSPGIIGIFKKPTPENIKVLGKPLPLQLICDNIRTPGNLGAILRAAVGVGCKKILLTKGCVNLWDFKVVRSASGAHFRIPIYESLEWNEISQMVDDDSSVFVADNDMSPALTNDLDSKYSFGELPILPYYSVEYPNLKNITVIIGGETEGISEESYRFATQRNGLRLNIPLQIGIDSLNTGMAAAVITCEIRKQMLQSQAKFDFQLAQNSSRC